MAKIAEQLDRIEQSQKNHAEKFDIHAEIIQEHERAIFGYAKTKESGLVSDVANMKKFIDKIIWVSLGFTAWGAFMGVIAHFALEYLKNHK